MRFVINYGLGNIDHGVPIARAAEAAGFASLGIPDSFFYPKHSDSRYPYTPDGGRSFIEHQAFLDPCVWIATMAAATTRLRFYPSVYKLPARHPLAVAKMFSSLAHVTGNRVALGRGPEPLAGGLHLSRHRLGKPRATDGRMHPRGARGADRGILRLRGRVLPASASCG